MVFPLSYKVLTQVTEACLTTRSLNVSDCDLDINGVHQLLKLLRRLKELDFGSFWQSIRGR